jgi:hypothetical protein
MSQYVTDNTAMDNRNNHLICMVLRNSIKRSLYPQSQILSGFSARDHIPTLLDLHSLIKRIIFMDLLAEYPALPFA